MITDHEFSRAASLLGCEEAVIRAVAEVESLGDGFLHDGRPRILFEAHVFSRLTNHQYDAAYPQISSLKWNRGLYRSGAKEHDRLNEAMLLDRDSAMQSASWGMFQIMGFNWRRCAYSSLQAFIDGMYHSEGEHLTAFCHLIRSMGLVDELQRKDWTGFASIYNGPSFAANNYDSKMALAYGKFK